MDLAELNFMGERGLISAIINSAIKDAVGYKRPRPPELQVSKVKKRKLIYFYNSILGYFENLGRLDSFHTKLIKSIQKHIKRIKRLKISNSFEKHAWEARGFFKENNKLLKFYCGLLDIDVIALIENVFKHIRKKEGLLE
jgi:hypothetical protein